MGSSKTGVTNSSTTESDGTITKTDSNMDIDDARDCDYPSNDLGLLVLVANGLFDIFFTLIFCVCSHFGFFCNFLEMMMWHMLIGCCKSGSLGWAWVGSGGILSFSTTRLEPIRFWKSLHATRVQATKSTGFRVGWGGLGSVGWSS